MSSILQRSEAVWLTRASQAKRYDVSVRTIVRWDNVDMGMPAEYELGGQLYRRLDELEAWERSRMRVRMDECAASAAVA